MGESDRQPSALDTQPPVGKAGLKERIMLRKLKVILARNDEQEAEGLRIGNEVYEARMKKSAQPVVGSGEIPLNTIQEGETPGKAYARLVKEATSHTLFMRNWKGNEDDPVFRQVRAGLESARNEVAIFYSENSTIHDPLVSFDRIVSSRVDAINGIKPHRTRTRRNRKIE